jgi:hypothetical protein
MLIAICTIAGGAVVLAVGETLSTLSTLCSIVGGERHMSLTSPSPPHPPPPPRRSTRLGPRNPQWCPTKSPNEDEAGPPIPRPPRLRSTSRRRRRRRWWMTAELLLLPPPPRTLTSRRRCIPGGGRRGVPWPTSSLTSLRRTSTTTSSGAPSRSRGSRSCGRTSSTWCPTPRSQRATRWEGGGG